MTSQSLPSLGVIQTLAQHNCAAYSSDQIRSVHTLDESTQVIEAIKSDIWVYVPRRASINTRATSYGTTPRSYYAEEREKVGVGALHYTFRLNLSR